MTRLPISPRQGDRQIAGGRLNGGWTYRDRVDRAAAGLTVLVYYTQRYRHSSEYEWRDRLKDGQILLDGCPTTPETMLEQGQELIYHRPPWREPDVPLAFEVLYEDAEVLAIAKPAGLPVLPGGGFLEHTLLWQLQRGYPHETPLPVHRLGRGTSGLVLLARSPHARGSLTQQLRQRTVKKVYWAIASGRSERDYFSIDVPIAKWPHPVLGYVYGATAGPECSGKFARSDCRVLRRDRNAMLVEVAILTGRPHQIRIHLAAAGFPLVGDPLYGKGGLPQYSQGKESASMPVPGDCGYRLHARLLEFKHPISGKTVELVCPAPDGFQEMRLPSIGSS